MALIEFSVPHDESVTCKNRYPSPAQVVEAKELGAILAIWAIGSCRAYLAEDKDIYLGYHFKITALRNDLRQKVRRLKTPALVPNYMQAEYLLSPNRAWLCPASLRLAEVLHANSMEKHVFYVVDNRMLELFFVNFACGEMWGGVVDFDFANQVNRADQRDLQEAMADQQGPSAGSTRCGAHHSDDVASKRHRQRKRSEDE
ncbi:hypothetical protein B0H14DRAFT_2559158 [Mycena olivaceomarginata]|nr:hypothetical protein B0H14DRAFT_2559158 [Mycena olivaceomarginata]